MTNTETIQDTTIREQTMACDEIYVIATIHGRDQVIGTGMSRQTAYFDAMPRARSIGIAAQCASAYRGQ